MKEALSSLALGIMVGIIFRAFKLPVPAPNVFPGITGIFGLYLGWKLLELFLKGSWRIF